MLQKPSSVPLFCQNLTTVILFYQVLQNIFLTNSNRSKIRQPDLSSRLSSTNTSKPSFRNFTGYQYSQESSIKSQLCDYPVYLSELLTVYRPSRQLRSISDTRTFRIPFTKTKTFGQRAFSFTGPTEWNSLPYDVRHSVSTSSFKQALKTHLFKSA